MFHIPERLYFQIGLTAAAIFIVLVLRFISRYIIRQHAKKYDLDNSRKVYANKFFNFTLSIVLFIVIGAIWDISIKGLSIYLASFAAIAGVALFAQWSIISSFTASIILFFHSPYKLGSRIRILDGSDSVEGIIKDIKLFSIYILTDEGDLVSYPNNLVLQKPIVLKSQQ